MSCWLLAALGGLAGVGAKAVVCECRDMRASDAERAAAVEILQTAVGEGPITMVGSR